MIYVKEKWFKETQIRLKFESLLTIDEVVPGDNGIWNK